MKMKLLILLLLGSTYFSSVRTTRRTETRLIDGIFTEPTLKIGYHLIATIPMGATNLNVTELRRTNNFLAVRLQDERYLLNGNYSINWSGIYKSAGTNFVYHRQSRRHLESLTAVGPLNEPIDVMLLYQEPNSGIVYRYHEPVSASSKRGKNNSATTTMIIDEASASSETDSAPSSFNKRYRNKRKFAWRLSETSACSKTCGGGIETRSLICVREHTMSQVPMKRCHGLEKPSVEQLRCNVAPCPPTWRLGSRSECSVTCGIGVRNRRDYECVQQINEFLTVRVADGACLSDEKILAENDETCVMPDCPDEENHHRNRETAIVSNVADATSPVWQVGEWSECSASCGHGERTRSVTCITSDGLCSTSTKPVGYESCDTTGDCPGDDERYGTTYAVTHGPGQSRWLHTAWSQQGEGGWKYDEVISYFNCSSGCGTGIETRGVVCLNDEYGDDNQGRVNQGDNRCDDNARPESVRSCSSNRTCGTGQWFAGPWSQCSASCDSGEQTRSTVCVAILREGSKILRDVDCPLSKPETKKSCGKTPCASSKWYTSSWSQCTKSCGTGSQKRDVRCLSDNVNSYDLNSRGCNETERPTSTRTCNDHQCKNTIELRDGEIFKRSRHIEKNANSKNDITGHEDCKDKRTNCALVTQARLCAYPYYRTICCASCLKSRNEE